MFRSLKNFTQTSTIENYLPKHISEFSNIIYIFDGIDEIADIEDFKSKIEVFVSFNLKSKFIISCRTNIFENIAQELPDFKSYVLNDLSYFEGFDLLKMKCGAN